jgi:RNA polymerase sigma-70 factor, ECF subfamily
MREPATTDVADLVVRVATGNVDSFAELYDRTCPYVYGLILQVLQNAAFAEEITQDVYLQVWRTAHQFDPAQGSALSWIVSLAHARAVDRARSEQSNTDRGIADMACNEPDRVDGPLAILTDAQRAAVTDAYYCGRTYREVAADLDVAVPTVKSRIRDGIARLRASALA